MEDVELGAAVGLCLLSLNNYINELKRNNVIRKRRKRRLWMTSMHLNRTLSSMENVFDEMTCEESGEFSNFCRMSPTDFEFLLSKIEPMIKKQNRLRMAIPPKIRLAITLRYLATGDSYRSLHHLFKISAPAISLIVPEVCKAISFVLKDQIKLPQTPEEWLTVEEGFRHNFPRCVGALDGKHIVAQCPTHKGPEYSNYKGTCNIVLMTLIDSDYRFIFADTGGQERTSDGGFFRNSPLWQKMDIGVVNFPSDTPLPGRRKSVPYVFLGDEALALNARVLKPFPGDHGTGTMEGTFNHKLSSARAVVDNVFGVLTSVYRIFRKPIEIDVRNVPLITMTCILLHNFLRKSESSRDIYNPPGTFDSIVDGQFVGGSWRQRRTGSSAIRSIPLEAERESVNISEIQSEFANYFHTLN